MSLARRIDQAETAAVQERERREPSSPFHTFTGADGRTWLAVVNGRRSPFRGGEPFADLRACGRAVKLYAGIDVEAV